MASAPLHTVGSGMFVLHVGLPLILTSSAHQEANPTDRDTWSLQPECVVFEYLIISCWISVYVHRVWWVRVVGAAKWASEVPRLRRS